MDQKLPATIRVRATVTDGVRVNSNGWRWARANTAHVKCVISRSGRQCPCASLTLTLTLSGACAESGMVRE